MTRSELNKKKMQYIADGKEALRAAQEYLTAFCDTWDAKHNSEYLSLLHNAESLLTKAVVVDELLDN